MKRNELILFIEQVVNQTISEIATGVDQAAQNGMALYVSDKGSSRSFILYNPGELQRALEDPAYEKRLHLNPGKLIVGVIDISHRTKCDGAWVVNTVAAEKGFGPLMYDIAFSSVGKAGLISDRDTVSNSARKIWKYIGAFRKSEFSFFPINPDNYDCIFPERRETYLNYRYVLNQPVDTGRLIQRSNEFLKTVESKLPNSNPIEKLDKLANKFFNGKNEGWL